MPRYAIERQYLLPVYEQLLIEAPSFEAACQEALDEIAHPWCEDAEQDFDNARPVTITEAVEVPEDAAPELQIADGTDHAGLGHLLYNAGLDPLPVPAEFAGDAGDDGEAVGFS